MTQNLISKRKKLLGSWYEYLKDEFEKEYMKQLSRFLAVKYKVSNIYPHKENIFKAFKECTYNNTKVVIIGQDPYHTPETAHGLVFSSKQDKTPPSLANVFKEINSELGIHTFNHNNLTKWANQGILLLNVALTVEEGKPKSHMKTSSSSGIGWEIFTDKVIEVLNNHDNKIIFLLWGNFAKSYKSKIDKDKHIILEAAHPSPFSAHKGFFGCGHFKIIKNKYPEIDFNLY